MVEQDDIWSVVNAARPQPGGKCQLIRQSWWLREKGEQLRLVPLARIVRQRGTDECSVIKAVPRIHGIWVCLGFILVFRLPFPYTSVGVSGNGGDGAWRGSM